MLGYLAELLTTEEIAATMFVSVNTVRSHVRSILRKLGSPAATKPCASPGSSGSSQPPVPTRTTMAQ